jgi:DNA-binding MarR family transcriptional regulator
MIDGIATFTMVLSTMIKDTPRLMKNSPIQRLLSMLSNIAPADRYARRVGTPEFEDWSLGRLLSTAARLVEHDWNSWLASHELTHAGLLALHALRRGPLTQRQLAAANRVEEQTMSRVVERLERTGYVTRERDSTDRRRLVISPTPAGTAVFERVQAESVADQLVERWVRDSVAFRSELARIISGARSNGADRH